MAYEHKPGNGSAFVNKDKKEDWHADFRGDIMLLDGSIHYLDVKPAVTQAGDTYYKVKIGGVKVAKGAAPMAPSEHNQAKANGYQNDSDIPF